MFMLHQWAPPMADAHEIAREIAEAIVRELAQILKPWVEFYGHEEWIASRIAAAIMAERPQWRPIEEAPLGKMVWLWHASWRHPFGAALKTMTLYRVERIKWFRANPDKIGDDDHLPPELSREIEAAAVVRAVRLANPTGGGE